MTSIVWSYKNDIITSDSRVNLGSMKESEVSDLHTFSVKHTSKLPIQGCGIYIMPKYKSYEGSSTALKDYESIISFGERYDGVYGLFVVQSYEVTGTIDYHDSLRIFDYTREEKIDIFTNSYIEIMSGEMAGESRLISSYDVENQYYTLSEGFTESVEGENYRIKIYKETPIRSGIGTGKTTAIPLIYKGGVIGRLEEAEFSLFVRTPPYLSRAMHLSVDVGLTFISSEN